MAVSTITITSGASTLIPTVEPVVLTLGTVGPQGIPGAGVAAGGTTGQILAKNSATNYDTGWIDNYTTDVRKYVKNDSGGTLAKGSVVYVSGANGANVLVKPALATADSTSATTIGILLQSLANNAHGWVIVEGTIADIDTSAGAAGDPVWLSGTVAGGVVYGLANKPQAPTHLVYLGTVTRSHAVNGSIEVSVSNGWELDELHNVKITSPTNGQVLTYDAANSLWVNSSETGDISAVNVTAPITGGGTSGAVTIGIDQTALAIGPSQVTGTAVITTDPRLSDARTPTAHAASHAAAGSDPVTLAQSQVINLTTDLAGKAALGAANAFTVGGHVISNAAAATIPLTVKGASGQSVDVMSLQDSTGTLLMRFTNNGTLFANNLGVFGNTTGALGRITAYTGSAATIGAVIRGAASQTANLQEWQDSTPTTVAAISPFGSMAIGATGYLGRLTVYTNAASTIGTVVRGAASQTANLQEWQNSAGTILARVNSSGTFLVNGGSYMEGNGRTFINSSSAAFIPLTVRGTTSQTGNLTEWQNSSGTNLGYVSASGGVFGERFATISNQVALRQFSTTQGAVQFAKASAAISNVGADFALMYFRDGTTAGTLKLVVRAGAAGAETTILDNIPQ